MNLAKYVILLFIALLFINSSCKKPTLVPVGSTSNLQKVVVVLGSSTAAGWGASSPDSSWVGRLKTRFKEDGNKIRVINFAVGGYTTYQVLPSGYSTGGRPSPDTNANVTKALELKPDLVLINMPTNDIANGYSDQEILYNFYVITSSLSKKSIPFIVTGTQPRNFPDISLRRRIKSLDDSLISRYGDSVNNYLPQISTDSWQIIPQYSYGDGIHLNNKGHAIIYNSFMEHPILRKALKY